jgi:PhnB protein
MTIAVTPHLNFRGNARAALTRYQEVFGGHLVAVTYADVGNVADETEADQIMWGQVASEHGFRVMAYDVPGAMPYDAGTTSYFVSVRGADADEVRGYWDKLIEGSTAIAPFGPAAWSPAYGMLVDPFGVTWVFDVEVPYEG